MGRYLYAVIPFEEDKTFQPDEYGCDMFPRISQLEELSNEYADANHITRYKDFILVNTCDKFPALLAFDDKGRNYLRDNIYEIASKLNAKEVWYIEEECTDEMEENDFSFSVWKQQTESKYSYCTMEYSHAEIKERHLASIIHDDFHDIDEAVDFHIDDICDYTLDARMYFCD